jgi:hypothetical protein
MQKSLHRPVPAPKNRLNVLHCPTAQLPAPSMSRGSREATPPGGTGAFRGSMRSSSLAPPACPVFDPEADPKGARRRVEANPPPPPPGMGHFGTKTRYFATARLPSALRLDSTELIEVRLEESSPKSDGNQMQTDKTQFNWPFHLCASAFHLWLKNVFSAFSAASAVKNIRPNREPVLKTGEPDCQQ